ncbi:MAG: hypothetical protein OXT67_08090 [Zetaproteobacteria bacterium]|nr:hypothetical protein [Zetaproteobacteria bacterium]
MPSYNTTSTSKPSLPPIHVGWIPYWNLHPFRCELENLSLTEGFHIRSGIPSEVNHWLHSDQVELAPCSSIQLLNQPDVEMAMPLGVAADGPVHSVYLGFQAEHKPLIEILKRRREYLAERATRHIRRCSPDLRSAAKHICTEIQNYDRVSLACIPKLSWHSESASSNGLARLLFNLWFGESLCKLMIDSGRANVLSTCPPVEVVIGDDALKRRGDFYKIWDMGSLWKELTGLPFVYAVWQSKHGQNNPWKTKILELGQKAERRMRVDSSHYMPDLIPRDSQMRELPLAKYWASIYYCLGPTEMRSLVLFLSLCKALRIGESSDHIVPKLIKWQNMSHKPSLAEIQGGF